MPVDDGVVEADLEAFAAKGVDHGLEQVALCGRVGRFVVCERRIPQAEAIVVFGGDDKVLHARVFGFLRPGGGVVKVGVKVVEIFLVVGVVDQLATLDPFVTRGTE